MDSGESSQDLSSFKLCKNVTVHSVDFGLRENRQNAILDRKL